MSDLFATILILYISFSFVVGVYNTITAIVEKEIGLGRAILMSIGIVGTLLILAFKLPEYLFNKLNKKILWRW